MEEEIPADYAWQASRPRIGDSLLSIGRFEIRDGSYSDYIRTLRGLSSQVGDTIEVRWRDQKYARRVHSAQVTVQISSVVDLLSARACGFSRNC